VLPFTQYRILPSLSDNSSFANIIKVNGITFKGGWVKNLLITFSMQLSGSDLISLLSIITVTLKIVVKITNTK
jgi:hypothetical protein